MIFTPTRPAKSAPRTRRATRLRAAAVGVLVAAGMARAAAVELTMWVMPVTTNAQHDVPDLIAPWVAQHPGVTVRVTVLDWESGWNKITAAAASRRGPDLLELGTTWMPAIAAMGGLEKLSKAQLAEVGNGAPYYPELWKTTQVFGQPGVVYGLPWYADVRAAFYRTDVFRQAGVDPKQAFADWDSFHAALRRINGQVVAGKRVAALAYAGKNDWNVVHNLAPWIWNAGGDVLTADAKRSALDTPQALRAIDFYSSLAVEGLVPSNALEKDSDILEGAWVGGDYGVIFSGPWLMRRIFEAPAGSVVRSNFDVAPYPAGPHGHATFFGGSNLAIFKGSRHKAEAWDLMKYLGSEAPQVRLSLISSMMPARVDAANDPAWTSRHPVYAKLTAIAADGRAYPPIPAWGPLETVYTKHLGQLAELTSGIADKYSVPAMKALIADTVVEADKVLEEAN
ncbi:extracellular solute-binding protein [Scleromatobacter humisilvae]|uniref:Extracellular solute-binding protein n=1 Tax=Scleromatobacter humisilvae TaxID=2897159 RepID=A0A9X2C0B0_9BURK|nr:extracellular solute-binding protein [Scleromatobacter humisilvae]MCK9687543.1 extracellular solute-binding protein [Scleromatobacter humisilvae]